MTQDFLVRILADGLVVPIVIIGSLTLVIGIPKGQRLEAYKRVLMAGLTSYLVAKLVASVYQPSLERPFELMGAAAGASSLNNPGFPSDHMLFITAITLAVWFETRRKLITISLAIMSILVGIGRVLALVHTPLDVVGGIVIASVGTLWYFNKKK